MTDDTEPRVPPLDMAHATEEQAALLDAVGGQDALHLFRTLAHNPQLARAWLRFGGQLLQRSSLPARDRELVILRVAALCGSDYEWGQHVRLGRDAGLADEEIERIAAGPTEGWTPRDEALLRATDELVLDRVMSDATWAAITDIYDTAQSIELTLLAGHYAMLAASLRTLGVQTEQPMPRIGTT